MLIRGVRFRPMRLMAILRRMARLRAAVRSRTRLSSSRKVTSRTQWSPFSMVQRLQVGNLRADEHAPADQAAMTVVEGIEHRLARGAAGETVLLATLLYRQK